jgi:hypothetical protein
LNNTSAIFGFNQLWSPRATNTYAPQHKCGDVGCHFMRVLLLIVIIILTGSCDSGSSSNSKSFKSFISDSLTFERHQNLTNALNLSQINQGVDSFELRLWSSLAPTDLAILTILKFIDSAWHLTETQYWISYTNKYPAPDLFILDSSTTKKQGHKVEFSALIDSIESFNLQNIPDQNKIPDFRDGTADGMYYTLEVATKTKYKIFSYHNPARYQDSTNRKVTDILVFLQRNLNAFVMN